ncbi:exonuclease SbcCD subunit D C-terminal domain-containing protein [bacterium]|nr:exonuclease SbcCD subunit D C-terminal domain-containing protein [candidate division CSSED10-310 bacterium]
MVKLIHTGDWHLGSRLDVFDRADEHRFFLKWLLNLLHRDHPDCLLVCGDVFDSANPPVSAQQQFFSFLVSARSICPTIIVIAGNHDSAPRFDAFGTVFKELGITIAGSQSDSPDSALIPIRNRTGDTIAVCAAIPYLRGEDLPAPPPGETPDSAAERLICSVSKKMETFEKIHSSGDTCALPLIYAAHLFIEGGSITADSERPIQTYAGNLLSLPPSIFPETAAYIALGHLHRAQHIHRPSGHSTINYSGSVIPLSFTESSYRHQVTRVEINGREVRADPELIPQSVRLLDITGNELETIEQVQKLTSQYPGPEKQIMLRVIVDLKSPSPDLRRRLLESADGTGVTIVAVRRREPATDMSMQDTLQMGRDLEELQPDDMFRMLHRQEYGEDPPDELNHAFHLLLNEILEASSEMGVD